MCFSNSEGRKYSEFGVHKGSCVYTCTFIKVIEHCSEYMDICFVYVILCSRYAKINGDALSMCPLDVLRSHLQHLPMF